MKPSDGKIEPDGARPKPGGEVRDAASARVGVAPWRRPRVLAGLIAVVAVGILIGVVLKHDSEQSDGPPPDAIPVRLQRPAAPADDYVGSVVCAECHAEISQRYAHHPMARSTLSVAEAPTIEDFEHVRFSPTPRREYWVERRGDSIAHHELGKGADGEVLFDESVPIEYVVGSGQRGRSYVLRRDAYLFMSPISWYSADNRWDLSPQYEPERHRRFERPASDRCLQCHVGRVKYLQAPTAELAQRYAQPPFTEVAIGCERCHGPAARHVEYRRALRDSGSGKRSGAAVDAIVNPGKLDPARRDAVCNQCHLQGDAIVLRYGRTHGDFRPGDLLGDIWTIFVGDDVGVADGGETRAVSQVSQMRASQCFQQSSRKLGCVSCHDPHELPEPSAKEAYYEAKCQTCHASQGCRLPLAKRQADLQKNACISCHMPRLDASDVPHTVQTDHRILRQPEQTETPNAKSTEPTTRVFDLDDCPLTPSDLDRAWGIRLSQIAETNQLTNGAELAQERLLRARKAAPDDVDVLDALAVTYVLQGNQPEAERLWRSALAMDPNRQNVLFSMAVLLQNKGDLPQASIYLAKLLSINPWQAEAHGRYSQVLRSLGKMPEAIQAAERSRELDPSRVETYARLKELRQLNGENAESQRLDELLQKLRTPPSRANKR